MECLKVYSYVKFCIIALIVMISGNIGNGEVQDRSESYQVLIIGAGASGIAAATRLMGGGMMNLTILEAENRMGGRVFSAPFEHGVLDMGGQWVHGQIGNVVNEMAEKLNLIEDSRLTDELFSPCFLMSSGQVLDSELGSMMMNFMHEIHNASRSEVNTLSGSLGEYFTPRFEEKVMQRNISSEVSKHFLRWYEKFQNSADSSDSWFKTSAHGVAAYRECGGNLAVSWKFGGYANVFNLLMNKYTSEKPPIFADKMIKYNKEVTKIDWGTDNSNIIVQCSDGSMYQAPHVIVTVSLGVLKERLHTMFQPALPPAKLRAIEGLSMGTLDKIYVKFPYRWWPNEYNGFHLLWTDENIVSLEPPANSGESVDGKHWLQEVSGFYEVDYHPLVLCGWITGPAARYMETLTDEQATIGVVYIMERFIGRGLNVSVPQPDRIIRSSWASNPHFRGSYSFHSMDAELMAASDLAEPIIGINGITVLQFGGEATNLHRYATVDGAVETGWREADRILSLHG